MKNDNLRRFHSAVWDEPVIMEMGVPGRRGCHFPAAEEAVAAAVGEAAGLIPPSMRRGSAPGLPEMSEPDVLRHFLHLSQETLGMMGISLFGTCTMKYNPRLTEDLAARPEVADLHPNQDVSTLQGALEIIHRLDELLPQLSGQDRLHLQTPG
ncbi:MAG: glycine dehydrogenase subunit 2, partial [Gammaproteobacteria bacterium]|nr:glycine dehydrogenase subunit 2 [Gammaproteobacteria bacterium]